MILVVGATGNLGGMVCQRLAAAGKPVRALVRTTSDPARRQALADAGVEQVVGDLKDPASIAAALRGVSTVVSTASATLSRQEGDGIGTVDEAGQLGLVDAAKAAGVQRFIFVSFPVDDIVYPLQTAKRAVEQRIMASGMDYTLLRPTMFTEVWLGPALGLDPAARTARVFGSGTARHNFISIGDVLRYVVESVDNPAVRNRALDLGGPDAVSQREVIAMLEEIGGKPFTIEQIPEEALRAQLASPDAMEATFAGLMLMCALGTKLDLAPSRELLPGSLASVREHLERIGK